jgi:hypothetical protein
MLLLSLLVAAAPALAQRVASTIRGAVSDTSGAVIVGAKVTVKNEATGFTRTAETNASGVYAFADLPVGTYSIDVEYPGFKASSTKGILVNVADVREVDIKLETGAITESVSVEVPAVSVKTMGGDVSGIITGAQVRELPLNGRNFLQLALLMPGVNAIDQVNTKDKGLLGGSDVSVSGGAVTSNLWTVDGANNNDVGSNRTILIYPSLEAIEEFKVQRASYSAEFGQAAGGQINIITRGGTNEFHGSVFYFGRNDALASRDYFLKQADRPKGELSRHDFGWNLGGPIMKDKLHFFASQEFNIERRGTVRAAFVPTAAERAGDFSGPGISGCSLPPPNDPLTGAPFANNRIPADRLSQGGLAYLQLYPLPNTTPVAGSCNNWVDSLTTPLDWRQENIRLDWTISNTTRLMARYTQDSWTNKAPNLNTNLWGDDAFPAVDSDWDQPAKSLMLQLTHNVGSKGVNTISFSYSANKIIIDRSEAVPGLNSQILSAIPPIYPLDQKQYGQDTGHPVFWGGGGYSTLWNEAPFRNNQDLYVLKDDYSAVFGKHRRLPREHEREERGLERQRLRAELGVLGLRRTQRLGRQHGQHPGRLPAQGHDLGLLRALRLPADADALEGPRVLRARLVEGQPQADGRHRRALVDALQLLLGRRHDDELQPRALQPRAGRRPLQRPRHGAGHEPLLAGRLPGRRRGAEPLAAGPEDGRDRTAPRIRV